MMIYIIWVAMFLGGMAIGSYLEERGVTFPWAVAFGIVWGVLFLGIASLMNYGIALGGHENPCEFLNAPTTSTAESPTIDKSDCILTEDGTWVSEGYYETGQPSDGDHHEYRYPVVTVKSEKEAPSTSIVTDSTPTTTSSVPTPTETASSLPISPKPKPISAQPTYTG